MHQPGSTWPPRRARGDGVRQTRLHIFRELLHHLDEHRIVAPSYFLQELVSKALTAEQHRVTTIVRRALTVADTEALECPGGGAGLYALTQLKREPKDFSAGARKHERQRGEQLQGLYRLAQQGVTAACLFPRNYQILCLLGDVLFGLQAEALGCLAAITVPFVFGVSPVSTRP